MKNENILDSEEIYKNPEDDTLELNAIPELEPIDPKSVDWSVIHEHDHSTHYLATINENKIKFVGTSEAYTVGLWSIFSGSIFGLIWVFILNAASESVSANPGIAVLPVLAILGSFILGNLFLSAHLSNHF